MEQDEDEFLYGNGVSQPVVATSQQIPAVSTPTPASAPTPSDVLPGLPGLSAGSGGDTPMGESVGGGAGEEESLEEGEEEEEEVEVEDSDDEIEFVIERKDGSRPEPPPQPSRYNQVRMAPSRPTLDANKQAIIRALDARTTPQPQSGPSAQQQSSQQQQQQQQQQQHHPPTSTSKLDLSANPAYSGQPIKSISLDSDTLLPADKPWRKPGADVTDYFNYGFDEFTWTAYCQKQETLREEYDPHKLMEQMMMLSGMGIGIPGMDPTAGMSDMGAMMNFGGGGVGGGVVPPSGPGGAGGAGDMSMGGMGDPSMYGNAMGGGFDERGGAYGMAGGGPRGGGMPPQGPNAGMGAYGGYDQGMMQQQQQQQQQQQGGGNRGYGPGGPRGRGGRRGW